MFRNFKKIISVGATCLVLASCAGWQRSCSSFNAEQFGSDWIVVQYKMDGTPFNCWKLPSTSITNEGGSDGIYWKDVNTTHLVHISGWYNRVQLGTGKWSEAATLLGVEADKCGDGKYPT